MNREQKQVEIEKLKDKFNKSAITILTDYKGLTVESFNSLRRKLREKNSDIKVVKNRLAKIALKGSAQEVLADYFKGTTAVTTTQGDPTGPAKVITEFAKSNDKVQFKAANMNGKALDLKQIETLAKLPSREELLAKLMGSMMSPMRGWVNVLSQIPRQFVNVLAQIRDAKEKESK